MIQINNSFFIVGTLTNGYFKNNETLIALNETSEDIKFYLKLENNLVTSNENEINATCNTKRLTI